MIRHSRSIGALLAGLVLTTVAMPLLQAQVDAPLLGYLPDDSGFRPVHGIPAAASIDAPVSLSGYSAIAASPAGDYALLMADDGTVAIYTEAGGAQLLEGAPAAPALTIVSPTGTSAAFFSAETLKAFVATGLPGSTGVREQSLAFLKELPRLAAISDDGDWLAVVDPVHMSDVYAFGPSGEVIPLPIAAAARALTFYPGGNSLAVAVESGLVRIEDLGGANRITQLASFTSDDRNERARRGDPSASSPVALAISQDAAHAIIALDNGTVLNYALNGGTSPAWRSAHCGCVPEGLFGMGTAPAGGAGARLAAATGPQVFRITGLIAGEDAGAGGAFLLYDAGANRILFVPVVAASGQAGGGQ